MRSQANDTPSLQLAERSPGERSLAAHSFGHGKMDEWVAGGAVAALGVGLAVLMTAWGSGSVVQVALGGAAAGTGLVVLIALGAVDGLAILMFALPLPAFYATSQLRIAPSAIVTLLVLVGWFVAWGPSGRSIRFPKTFRLPWSAFFVALVICTAFAQHHGAALRELANWILFLGLFLVAADSFARRPQRMHTIAIVVAWTVGLSGFAATMQSLSLLPSAFPMNGTSFNRATLGFGWPNELAMFMALGVPFSVYALQVAKRPATRVLALCGLGLTGLGLLTTFSRGSWLALVAATMALLLVGPAKFVLRACVLGVICAAILDVASGSVFSARAGSLLNDPSIIQRVSLQIAGLLMFQAHPIVGVGPGGFAESLDSYGPQVAGLYDYVGTAHNVYVDMAAETGILGLTAFLGFLFAAFRVLLSVARSPEAHADIELRRALFWSFSVTVFVGFTAWPFAQGLGQLIVIVLAAGVALYRDPQRQPAHQA